MSHFCDRTWGAEDAVVMMNVFLRDYAIVGLVCAGKPGGLLGDLG
jgi:hypothetical protein